MAVTTADGTLDWLVRSFANLGLSNYSKSQMGKTGYQKMEEKESRRIKQKFAQNIQQNQPL